MDDSRLIKGSFKVSFIMKFCLMVIGGAFLSGILLYAIWQKELGVTYFQAISTLVGLKQVLVPTVIITVIFQVIILSVVIIFLTLYVSHKIAGPTYRLEKCLEAIGKGDLTLTKITLRGSDQALSLAKTFEEMCGSIQQRIKEIKYSLYKINENKERFDKMVREKNCSKDDLEPIFKVLTDETEGLKEKLKEFKLGKEVE